jgi:1,4-dihydroxy-2-naphthoate octaprenyltransferase
MINNYLDKRRSGEKPHFSKRVSLTWIFSMSIVSALMGFYLTYVFGLPVLITGAVCFSVGVLYSFGPIPISRTPYGEIISGLVQGFCIIFLVVYINVPKSYPLVNINLQWPSAAIDIDIMNMIKLAIVTLPVMFCISNIMLANNTCDVERDTQVRRYTLPYYIGQKAALILYKWIYIAAYAAVMVGILLMALPWTCVLTFISIPWVFRNIKAFTANPVKSQTFVLTIKNFVLILFSYLISMFIGALIF